MFAGEFRCKLDDKGRFFIPSSIRELLDKGKRTRPRVGCSCGGKPSACGSCAARLGTQTGAGTRKPG